MLFRSPRLVARAAEALIESWRGGFVAADVLPPVWRLLVEAAAEFVPSAVTIAGLTAILSPSHAQVIFERLSNTVVSARLFETPPAI